MTKVGIRPEITWRMRLRCKMYVTSANTGGTLILGLGFKGVSGDFHVSSASNNVYVNLDDYAKGAWYDIEFFFAPTSWAARPMSAYVGVLYTDCITGGAVWISDLQLDETYQTGPNVPQKLASSAYTLKIGDQGQHIYITTGGVTVPNNSDVPFPVETTITIVNNSGSTQTISKGGSVTLIKAGSGSVSSLTLAAYGVCTLLKTASNVWWATGNVT